MKAIIDIATRSETFDHALTIARRVDAGEPVPAADYRLHFDSARLLFSKLTPSRVELLDTLRKVGACSVYALAKAASRNYSNVHSDVAALETLGLIERDAVDAVFVPFDSVEIHLGRNRNAVAA
ncbi:MAG: hypothetical protein QM741_10670 [Rudaea sp.]|uniref:HVO_A0114 family putative DNA-binding protein n=1 Tax=Rudaea sp. TaxID=2136325 RepID=UPI0039E5F8F6